MPREGEHAQVRFISPFCDFLAIPSSLAKDSVAARACSRVNPRPPLLLTLSPGAGGCWEKKGENAWGLEVRERRRGIFAYIVMAIHIEGGL